MAKSRSLFGRLMPFSMFSIFAEALSAASKAEAYAKRVGKMQDEINRLLNENIAGCDPETAKRNIKRVNELLKQDDPSK